MTITGFSQGTYDVLPIEGRKYLFNTYLLNEFDVLSAKRTETVEDAMSSKEKVLTYQAQLYKDFVPLFGEFPEKTPLNPEVVGTVSTAYGYHIEKLHYQSRLNHHVTANLYIPETGTGPYPAVVILCGHYSTAKFYSDYQNLSILLAKNGISAFIIDPICQGERYQFHNAEGNLTKIGTSGTSSLSKLDVGASLVGGSAASHLLWDNIRGVDYLFTRTDVIDTSRVGCTGHSGGGAQATNLIAYDKRIKAGAVANYLSNETWTFKELQPQVSPQNLAFEGVFGIDQPSYIEMFAPKPFMIIATTVDFFPIEGSRETLAEVQSFYDILGAKDEVTLFETSDAHDYTKIKREAAVRWFKMAFTANNEPVIEADQVILCPDSLEVTSTGLVYTSFPGEKTVQDINLEIALNDSVKRKDFWTNNPIDSCLSMVKHLIRLKEDDEPPVSEITETMNRGTFTIDKIKITSGNNVPITGLLFKPKNLTSKVSATLFLDGDGKNMQALTGGILETRYVAKGKIVFSIDVRGFGETSDADPSDFIKHGNNEFRNNMISLYLGKTLIGQRVEDIMKAVTVLLNDSDVDPDSLNMEGIGRAATAVLHAAALDTRIKSVVLRKTIESMIVHVEDPSIENGMTHQVNSALKYYDLPDLVDAVPPRSITYAKSFDAYLSKIIVRNARLGTSFDPHIFEYEIINPYKSEIVISPTANDLNAVVAGKDTIDLTVDGGKEIELVVTAEDGESQLTYRFTLPEYTAIDNQSVKTPKFMLEQNFPNLFNPSTTIQFEIPERKHVKLEIFNLLGERIDEPVNEIRKAGMHKINLDLSNWSSGIYYY